MAGASMKDIKLRIKSVEGTMQITKAMELVASSKLRRAKERVEHSRPYFDVLHAALDDIAYSNDEFRSPYMAQRPVKKSCYVVIAGDRGLAGGYNANILKAVAAHAEGKNWCVLPIGKKALEHYRRRGVPVVTDRYAVAGDVEMSGCYDIARTLAKGFVDGEFDEIILAYTNFVSMLSQQPATLKLLPLNYRKAEKGSGPLKTTLYEPDSETVYNAIVPEYLAGLIWGALCESVASELGARRTAMDAASKNAGEMIENLSLHYNRARQAAITQEITEIVAGAEG